MCSCIPRESVVRCSLCGCCWRKIRRRRRKQLKWILTYVQSQCLKQTANVQTINLNSRQTMKFVLWTIFPLMHFINGLHCLFFPYFLFPSSASQLVSVLQVLNLLSYSLCLSVLICVNVYVCVLTSSSLEPIPPTACIQLAVNAVKV